MTQVIETRIQFSLTGSVPVLSVSEGISKLLGYTPDTFMGGKVSLKERIHADDQDIADELFSVESTTFSGMFNMRLRDAEGRIRCVKVEYAKRLEPSVHGFVLDLTLWDARSLWQNVGAQPLLDAMMDNAEDFIYFKDRNHVFTGASQTLVAITNPSEHWTDLLGQTDYDVFPEHLADVYYRLEKQVFAGIKVAHEIQKTLDNDGVAGWVDNRKYPLNNSQGEITGLFGIARIITPQKLVEESLRKTNAYLDDLFNFANAPIIVWDTSFRISRFNKALETLTGRTSDEVIGSELSILLPADQIDSSMALIKSMLSGERLEPVEISIIHVNGTVRIVLWSLAYLYAEDGTTPTATIMQGQDITERKQAEEDLQDWKNLVEAVVENVPLMIFLKEATDLRFVIFNRAGEELVGHDRKDFLGKDDLEFFPLEQATNFMAKDREVLNLDSGFVDIPEESIMTAKKGLRLLHTRKVCIRGGDGVTKYVLGISEDITDRKKADEEKQTLEQQLQHTQKLESLGVLSGGIAHDFNNILAIILGYCGLTKIDYETAQKHIPIIETAAERAAALCRQMLAYAGKAQLTKSKVNMVTKVGEIVNMLKSSLPQNAVIKTDFSAEIPFIEGDASQLRQVVMNLIINASEAIGTEQGEVSVSLTKVNVIVGEAYEDYHGKEIPPGEYVCLEVTDNGCGMDETTKWRIFEPFYTTKFTGRGLGMSAVLGIIKSHGGALQLFSQLGQGSTFKVYLPVSTSGITVGEDQKASAPSAPWQGSGTILLVEDEDEVRHIAKALLKNFGFTVLEAVNGKEALEMYQKNGADITLVVTDMGMPVMDGYEMFHKLKSLNSELPIIISSGYGDAEVSSRIGSDNIAGLISKPYNPDQLREVLKRVVGGCVA